jgi:hypothetical protein
LTFDSDKMKTQMEVRESRGVVLPSINGSSAFRGWSPGLMRLTQRLAEVHVDRSATFAHGHTGPVPRSILQPVGQPYVSNKNSNNNNNIINPIYVHNQANPRNNDVSICR